MSYRITADIGGTFSDVVASDEHGGVYLGKAPTTPDRAFDGVSAALTMVGEQVDSTVSSILGACDLFVYSTTRATNAILERKTAKTAMLLSAGFPDVLVLREGGKLNPFELRTPYPEPYVPRRLTFEVPGRIDSEGSVVDQLDEQRVSEILDELRAREVEAIAVCLMWSVANGEHERRVGELIEQALPAVPYTLSHQINPIIREYRRASSAAIDASLKPLMASHLVQVGLDLEESGFRGELMAATSFGGVMHIGDLGARPIFSVKSGPALAPVAGLTYAEREIGARDVIVCDTGGTSFDVSLVRGGAVSFTRDSWLGGRFSGHLLGSSTVDVRSIGAGGGSVAWIDPGGLLRVGPESAGAVPGPACYGRGGDHPTVTDAAVVAGYLDLDTFLGGRMKLDGDAAHAVIARLAGELGGVKPEQAADTVLQIANEHMVQAIQEITVNEGVDPRESLVLAGGGAAGLGIAAIVRELGCRNVLVPRTAGALSAVGGQFSDIVAEFAVSRYAQTDDFDFAGVNQALADARGQAEEFHAGLSDRGYVDHTIECFAEARYAYQVWELELPLPSDRFDGPLGVQELSAAFDALHERIFAVSQPGARVEVLAWKARLRAPTSGQRLSGGSGSPNGDRPAAPSPRTRRQAHFPGVGWQATSVFDGPTLLPGGAVDGPAIVEEPTTTLVVPPETRCSVTPSGNYLLEVK